MNDQASRIVKTEQPVGLHEPIRELLEGLSLCSPGPEYFRTLVSELARTLDAEFAFAAGVPGKRALVVFTDCYNNAGSATPAGVLQYSREIGVPLYVVQLFTGSRFLSDESTLRKVAEATGGAFFHFARKADLPSIFSQIRDDTRGEYLLTYVSPGDQSSHDLRKISVDVPGRKVTVRATSGYYPR